MAAKHIKLLSLFAVLCSAIAPALALSAESATIYLVDVQRVINESIEGKAARNSVEDDMRKSESKLAKMKADIDKQAADLDKQAALLSADALQEKQKSLERTQRALQEEAQASREELTGKHNAAIEKVIKDIDVVINQLAEGGKYPVILEKDPRVVVYAHERLDITDEVIKRLDSRKSQFK